MDEIFGIALLIIAVLWIVLDAKREWRRMRQADWEAHVTSAPGMQTLPATDWDAWSDELKGWA